MKEGCENIPQKTTRGEKDVTVSTTAGGPLVTHPAAPKKPNEPLKPTANGSHPDSTRCFDGSNTETHISRVTR
jgi:hypothetical protein